MRRVRTTSCGAYDVEIEFRGSKDGDLAFYRGLLVGSVIAPLSKGGDYWCRNHRTGQVSKGLSHEQAYDLIRTWARRSDERDIGPTQAIQRRKKPEPTRGDPTPRAELSSPPAAVWTTRQITPSIPPGPPTGPLVHRKRSGIRPPAHTAVNSEVEQAIATMRRSKEAPLCPICRCPLRRVSKHFRKLHPRHAHLIPYLEAALRDLPGRQPNRLLARARGTAVVVPAPPVEVPVVTERRANLPPTRDRRYVTEDGRPRKQELVGLPVVYRCLACCANVPGQLWQLHEGDCPGVKRRRPRGQGTRQTSATDTRTEPRPVPSRTAAIPAQGQVGSNGPGPGRNKGSGTAGSDRGRTRQPRDVETESRRERTADATRGYADNFRERGRFGSHSAHDGYSDEDRP